ncbi:hypothetical protein BDV10DRAFT_185914 [Aspergillus recurvatus]
MKAGVLLGQTGVRPSARNIANAQGYPLAWAFCTTTEPEENLEHSRFVPDPGIRWSPTGLAGGDSSPAAESRLGITVLVSVLWRLKPDDGVERRWRWQAVGLARCHWPGTKDASSRSAEAAKRPRRRDQEELVAQINWSRQSEPGQLKPED